jgi:hypothetical protein
MLQAMAIGWFVAVGILTCFAVLFVSLYLIASVVAWWDRRA